MRVFAFAFSFLLLLPLNASACEYPRGPVFKLLEEWTKTCGHPLCGQIHIAEPGLLKEAAKTCDAKGWMSMREDIRATVVGGGAVLFGEVHDNPLHHDLRSRLGMSNFASGVFEQISVDKTAALEGFLQKLGKDYKDTSLADFKTAVEWDKSGWATYNYDPLLLAMLKARQPIFAGDPPADLVKKVAAEGQGALAADERARLKLDVALGDKADAASLDELVIGHCNMMAREALAPMAFAQRYRDAVLADSVLNAIAKRGAAILFAGNGHVRKDRGVPWYIHQRDGARKTLSIQLIEVEPGKTDPEAYAPHDADGKPAADYVIFTPRAERKDPCEAMKAKSAN